MASANTDLTFRYAQEHVAHYRKEEDMLMQAHWEAMDCYDCEAYLQLGIDAFNWLIKADAVIRRAIFKGQYQYDQEVDRLLQALFRGWLEPCENAEKWIGVQEKRGYTVTNLDDFRNCCEEVKAIVKAFDDVNSSPTMSAKLTDLRDQALQDYRNGETAEFV